MTIELGIIEGFYGPLWQWDERVRLIDHLHLHGYGFYYYAPKADPYLRRRWHEPHPPDQAQAMTAFAGHCDSVGVRLGVGLSPFEIFNHFDAGARRALADKLRFFDDIGVRDVAILFDDMRGDTPDLAARQAEIMHWVMAHSGAERLSLCPTYYSDDPVLDRVFGQRPENYLEQLGAALNNAIRVFWTGPEVCSREVSPGHLQRVAEALGRKPLLWDNYPVNDGERMSAHLHLRAFTGRCADNAEHLAGHAINPALQPTLTALPALTLAECYRQGADYDYARAFARAARQVLGEQLADQVQADLLSLQDRGLYRMSTERVEQLSRRYAAFEHPAAHEIVRWLAGEYAINDEQVQTQ